MDNKLTFGELVHSLTNSIEYCTLHLRYDVDESDVFWKNYLKLTDKNPFDIEKNKDSVREYLLSCRDAWFRNEIKDLIDKYDAENKLDDSLEMIKIILNYLRLGYEKIGNLKNDFVAEAKKDDCLVIATYEFWENLISKVYNNVFEKFSANYDIKEMAVLEEPIPDSVFDEWVSGNKLEKDIDEDWTDFYIYIYLADYLCSLGTERHRDERILFLSALNVIENIRDLVWYNNDNEGAEINRVLESIN